MHVGTGISAQQGMISISETKRNHMGQGLGNTGVRQNIYFVFLQKRRYERGHCHVEDGHV